MSSEIMSLEMNIFCLLLLIRILYQMYINREQNDHWNYFYHTIAWACVYLFMDAIWIMNVKHLLTFNKIQSGIFNSFYFCSLAMLVCSWYIYAQKTFHSTVFEHKKRLVLTFIPLIFFIGSSLVSYWTHGLFIIDQAGNYHRGKLLPFYFLILFAYILYLSIKAGYLSKKAKNYLYQKEYKVIARFSFLPFITALIQITADHLLIFNLGLAYSIFIVYNYFQQNLISLDPLTKINNREQLDIYLTTKMKENHQKKDLYLFLLDIDQFKKINDELGHVVGDQIILKTADILKQIAHLHNCFISRYGGDEFIIVCERDKNVEITPIFNDLQRLFQQSYEGLPDFSVSIGYVKYDESLNYIPKFIEKADHYMYLNKNVKK